MPTGYTVSIEKDISFRDFVLKCSEAFLGESCNNFDPISKELSVEPSYKAAVVEAKQNLDNFNTLSIDKIKNLLIEEYLTKSQRIDRLINSKKCLKEQYEKMLEQVKNWKAPTPNHNPLKQFMINQIIESIRFDCDIESNIYRISEIETIEDYIERKKRQLKEDIEYATKKYLQECENVKIVNDYVKALKDSLT